MNYTDSHKNSFAFHYFHLFSFQGGLWGCGNVGFHHAFWGARRSMKHMGQRHLITWQVVLGPQYPRDRMLTGSRPGFTPKGLSLILRNMIRNPLEFHPGLGHANSHCGFEPVGTTLWPSIIFVRRRVSGSLWFRMEDVWSSISEAIVGSHKKWSLCWITLVKLRNWGNRMPFVVLGEEILWAFGLNLWRLQLYFSAFPNKFAERKRVLHECSRNWLYDLILYSRSSLPDEISILHTSSESCWFVPWSLVAVRRSTFFFTKKDIGRWYAWHDLIVANCRKWFLRHLILLSEQSGTLALECRKHMLLRSFECFCICNLKSHSCLTSSSWLLQIILTSNNWFESHSLTSELAPCLRF